MIKVGASLSIGFPTAEHSDTFEFEDGTTDEEIEAAVQEWSWNYIELFWKKVEE